MRKATWNLTTISLLLMMMIAGCEPPDQRAVEVAREASQRQAEQNKSMTEQSRATTEAAKTLVQEQAATRKELTRVQEKLVDRDTQGRQDLNRLQQDVQKSTSEAQSHVDQERAKLEAARREIAEDRQRAPLVAEAVREVGLLLICLAPLLVAVYLLYTLRSTAAQDDTLTELLVEELVAEEPRRLSYQESPQVKSLRGNTPRTALPEPEDCDEQDDSSD